MAGESFDEKKMLSLEDLMENLHREVDHETENLHRGVDNETENLHHVIDLKAEKLHHMIEKTHRNIGRETDTTGSEILRRKKEKRGFLKNLCSQSIETWVWWILLEAGGAQRFTDVLPFAGCSRWKLNKVLNNLRRAGLVKKVENLYQAIVPPWLVQFLN